MDDVDTLGENKNKLNNIKDNKLMSETCLIHKPLCVTILNG